MPMDSTDKRLMNGLIWLTVLAALGYYFPGIDSLGIPAGYAGQKKREDEARNRLEQKSRSFERNYPPIHPAHYGDFSTEPVRETEGEYISDLKTKFQSSNKEVQQLIELKEKSSRMSFPEWTRVPDTDLKNPGVYFRQMWERKKNSLNTKWNEAKVECLDPDIGFKRLSGISFDEVSKSEEYLRELFIAEKIIELCIGAKLRQESFEKSDGLQPEAFMKIISVTPQESVATGPSALIPNPKYDPEVKKPGDERFRKYNVKLWKPFIQQYPVEIVLQCDVNTYMRFLHSVRAPGQFLVIRNLEIISPFLSESKEDSSELGVYKNGDEEKNLSIKDDHIIVKMSAAGMDFFDPVTSPRGLYDSGKNAKPAATTRRRREIKAE